VEQGFSVEVFNAGFARLGFSVKLKCPATLNHATFLKGMWYRMPEAVPFTLNGVSGTATSVWGPFPSRVLKMGKSLVDPRTIYGDRDLRRAGQCFMADMAQCYSRFVRVPLIRELVDAMAPFERRGVVLENDEPWKVRAAYEKSPGRVEDLGPLIDRYGLSAEDWAEMAAQLRSALPWTFVSHPGFEVLARVDYG